MSKILNQKIMSFEDIVQRYKRFGGYEIVESKLRAELPLGMKPPD